MRQVLHGVKQVPQPSPEIHEGGDCFACSAMAIMRHLFPRHTRDLSVADAVKWFEDTYHRSDKKLINNTMSYARSALHASGLDIEVNTDPFSPLITEEMQTTFAWRMPSSYAQRVEAYLAAGYVGYVDMNFAGAERGLSQDPLPDRPGHYIVDGNHIVVLDGIRTYWLESGEEGKDWSATQQTEVHRLLGQGFLLDRATRVASVPRWSLHLVGPSTRRRVHAGTTRSEGGCRCVSGSIGSRASMVAGSTWRRRTSTSA